MAARTWATNAGTIASTSVLATSSIDSFTKSVESRGNASLKPLGMLPESSATRAFTSAAVLSAAASPCATGPLMIAPMAQASTGSCNPLAKTQMNNQMVLTL